MTASKSTLRVFPVRPDTAPLEVAEIEQLERAGITHFWYHYTHEPFSGGDGVCVFRRDTGRWNADTLSHFGDGCPVDDLPSARRDVADLDALGTTWARTVASYNDAEALAECMAAARTFMADLPGGAT